MTSFMAQLSREQRDELYRSGHKIPYRSGQTLMVEGERGSHVLVIDLGDVKVVKNSEDGREQLLNICGRGELLGELGCFEENGRRSASVIAQTPGVVIKITKDGFVRFLNNHPALWPGIVRRVGDLLRKAEGQSAMKAIRVVRALATLADRDLGGSRGATIPYTQDAIAGFTQVSKMTVQRVLKNLKKRNLAYSQYRAIVVPCVRCLRVAADTAMSTQIYGEGVICCGGVGVCPQGLVPPSNPAT
jgi:CRP/FNR family transcriptional regulator, cyclic AMP receptor protein